MFVDDDVAINTYWKLACFVTFGEKDRLTKILNDRVLSANCLFFAKV